MFYELTSADPWNPHAHNDSGSPNEVYPAMEAQVVDLDVNRDRNNVLEENNKPNPLDVQNGEPEPIPLDAPDRNNLEIDPLDVQEGFVPAILEPDAAPGNEDQVPAIVDDINGNDDADDDDLDLFFDAIEDTTVRIINPPTTKAELDPGGHSPTLPTHETTDIFYDIMEDCPEAVTLKLNHSRLESESEIDCFLNHLDNDTLLGLQLRMTPIEYAIHVIQSRNQLLLPMILRPSD